MEVDSKDNVLQKTSNIKEDNENTKKFPSYFENFKLPEGAKEQRIIGYRACKTNRVDKGSFIPSYEENGYKVERDQDESDPSVYSLSLYENPKDVKRFAITNSDMRPPLKIAIGCTEPRCGVAQRTKERTKKKTSHIDWWLYENAEPHLYFELIEDFKSYYEEYKNNKKK